MNIWLPAKQHHQFGPFLNGPGHRDLIYQSSMGQVDWQCFLAGSSKTAPRILIFSNAMGANYSLSLILLRPKPPNFLDIIIDF